ncbi:MAG: hypothetical protein CL816_00510 [Coxiellaceae bacterium]|nr:hypothetical protein [Coxiellaceae bacterium]
MISPNAISSLLTIGFEGHSADHSFIQSLSGLPHPGGLIAFDRKCNNKNLSESCTKNIVNPDQLTELNHQLKILFPNTLISIDSEGGLDWTELENGDPIRLGVNRLKVDAGFPATLCAYQLGQLYHDGKIDQVKLHCDKIAKLLFDLNFNCVYAPVVDIHNEQCPIIGKVHRSFSFSTDVVTSCATLFIDACSSYGIQCCLKHYPGHGSSLGDTHFDQVDITQQWSEDELHPFHALANQCGMVMTSHVIHRDVDDLPVSLSKRWIDRLRTTGFDGVVISDDIQMAAAAQTYTSSSVQSLAALALRAFLAGNDMVIIGGQLSSLTVAEYQQLVGLLTEAVVSKQWPIENVLASVERVACYKQLLNQAVQ